jgi:chaperonin cofactor prefoldin
MNQQSIDRVSLEQALMDFEVANARVMDLTERLTTMSKELNECRQAKHELDALRHSRAFRALRVLGRIKRAIAR